MGIVSKFGAKLSGTDSVEATRDDEEGPPGDGTNPTLWQSIPWRYGGMSMLVRHLPIDRFPFDRA
jgi:hypothetical protein